MAILSLWNECDYFARSVCKLVNGQNKKRITYFPHVFRAMQDRREAQENFLIR